jgi:signal-transduction protein with cAMP-binding, CBS, and nucleotidyltransferase domain
MASPECWQRPVYTVMRANTISYEEDTPIRVIYEFLCRVSIRRVVITKNGIPMGTIGRNSLLQWFRNWVVNIRGQAVSPVSVLLAGECNIPGTASGLGSRTPGIEPAGPLVG